jgi:hypothetical protein
MLPIHLTVTVVLSMLSDVISRFGEDHTARKPGGGTGCVYAVQEGNRLIPVCIVGQVIADLGALRALVVPYETARKDASDGFYSLGDGETPAQYAACTLENPMWDRLAAFGITADDDAKALLRAVQDVQDGDHGWGEALKFGIVNWHNAQVENLSSVEALNFVGVPLGYTNS